MPEITGGGGGEGGAKQARAGRGVGGRAAGGMGEGPAGGMPQRERRGGRRAAAGAPKGRAVSPRGPLAPAGQTSSDSEGSSKSGEAGGVFEVQDGLVEVDHGGKTVVTGGRAPNKRAIRQLQELQEPGKLTAEGAAEVLAACEGDVARAAEALLNKKETLAKREEWHHPPFTAPPFPKKPHAAGAAFKAEDRRPCEVSHEVFVKGLDGEWGLEGTVERVHEIFGDCGTILDVRVPMDRRPEREGWSRGFAIIIFAEEGSREAAALKANDVQCGRRIFVDPNPSIRNLERRKGPVEDPRSINLHPHGQTLERRNQQGPQAVDSDSRFKGKGGLKGGYKPPHPSGRSMPQPPPEGRAVSGTLPSNYPPYQAPAVAFTRIAGPGNEEQLEALMAETQKQKEELRKRMAALEERERQMVQQSDLARRSRALRSLQSVERSLQECLTMARSNHESLARRQSRAIKEEFTSLRDLIDHRESAMLAEVEACRQADSRELFGAQQALLQLGGPACVEALQAAPKERFQTILADMNHQGQQVKETFLGEQVVLGSQGVQFKNCDDLRSLISAHGHVERADTTAAARLTSMPSRVIQAHQEDLPPLANAAVSYSAPCQSELPAGRDEAGDPPARDMNFAAAAKFNPPPGLPPQGPVGQTVAPPPAEDARQLHAIAAPIPKGPVQLDLNLLMGKAAKTNEAAAK